MLNEIKCKTARCPEGKNRLRLADSGGLYLEVAATSKRWFWKYRVRYMIGDEDKSKEKRLSLGSYPAVTIKEAREARDDARKTLGKGSDPVQKRQDEKLARRIRLGAISGFARSAPPPPQPRRTLPRVDQDISRKSRLRVRTISAEGLLRMRSTKCSSSGAEAARNSRST